MRYPGYLSIVAAISAVFTLTQVSPTLAGPSQRVPVGVRAIAMGSAYTSIADDASAAFWNPAGLPSIGHQEIVGTHADLFGTGIQDDLIGFALSLSQRSAAAVHWYHSGFEDPELNYGESEIELSYGRLFTNLLSVGATVKYLDRGTELDGVSVRRGHGFGLDLGLLSTPIRRLRIGVIGQDLFDTNVSYSTGEGTGVAYPMNFRGAISYSPIGSGILAFDVDDRWHVGAEYRPIPSLALRAGLQDDWSGPDAATWSAGAGVKVGLFRFDYALVDHPTLGSTSNFGLAMEFNFNPAQIRIDKVEPRDLYASLYKTYARQPVATMRVRNLDDRPLDTRLQVMIPGVMEQPSEHDVILRPKATEEISLSAVLGDEVMARMENRSIEVRVSATYQSVRLPRTESASAKGVLYAPGAIDWSKGVDQAAAFITTRDPAVEALARDATHVAALMPVAAGPQRNLAFAAALVDALASMDVAYVPDPTNPYSAISRTPRAVDTIGYPRETLARRSGDCDDTSVLLASLLGNVGIATMLVDVPGHIFILADTGVHERNRLGLGIEESRTVVYGERVWIPLETTAISKGFAMAWQEGAESYAAWSARGRVALVDVQRAFERFESAEPQSPLPRPAEIDTKALQERIAADLGVVEGWRQAYLRGRYGPEGLPMTPSVEALNEIARVQLAAGRIEKARSSLEEALTLKAGDVRSLSNLGTLLASQGDLAGAATRYEAALQLEDDDGGVWLNLGLVRYVMGDSARAEANLAEGIQRVGSYEQACALLALEPESALETDRGGGGKMTDAEVRELLKAALSRVPRPGQAAHGNTAPASVEAVTTRPWASRVAGSRSTDRDALREHLYWKER